MCHRIGEYIFLELFYFVSLASSCSLISWRVSVEMKQLRELWMKRWNNSERYSWRDEATQRGMDEEMKQLREVCMKGWSNSERYGWRNEPTQRGMDEEMKQLRVLWMKRWSNSERYGWRDEAIQREGYRLLILTTAEHPSGGGQTLTVPGPTSRPGLHPVRVRQLRLHQHAETEGRAWNGGRWSTHHVQERSGSLSVPVYSVDALHVTAFDWVHLPQPLDLELSQLLTECTSLNL